MKEQKRKKRGEKSIARDYSALKLNNDLSGSRSDDSNDENEPTLKSGKEEIIFGIFIRLSTKY